MSYCYRVKKNIVGLRDKEHFKAHHGYNWLFVILFGILFIVVDSVPKPLERRINPQDQSISLSFVENEIVPNTRLIQIVTILPIIIFLLYFVFWNGSLLDLNQTLLAYYQGLIVVAFITDLTKLFGELRPDFLDRCQLDAYGKCENTDSAQLKDGRQSFLSGHSSASFFFGIFMSQYICGKLGIFCSPIKPYFDDPLREGSSNSFLPSVTVNLTSEDSNNSGTNTNTNGNGNGKMVNNPINYTLSVPCAIVVTLPFMYLAAFISNSRIVDNRHHIRDVVCGSLLGSFFGIVYYNIYYHPIFIGESKLCALPRDLVVARKNANSKAVAMGMLASETKIN